MECTRGYISQCVIFFINRQTYSRRSCSPAVPTVMSPFIPSSVMIAPARHDSDMTPQYHHTITQSAVVVYTCCMLQHQVPILSIPSVAARSCGCEPLVWPAHSVYRADLPVSTRGASFANSMICIAWSRGLTKLLLQQRSSCQSSSLL